MASGTKTAGKPSQEGIDAGMLAKILEEGYGPGAWHGPDLKAALADVSPELAHWRAGRQRHSIAEIALHHAYCIRGVRGRLTGVEPEPFVLEGDDWFPLEGEASLGWGRVLEALDREQARLVAAIGQVTGRGAGAGLAPGDVRGLVLGVTCHAVYHAGQVQLLKRLWDERGEGTA